MKGTQWTSVHQFRDFVRLLLKRAILESSLIEPRDFTRTVEENQVGCAGILETHALFPGIRTPIDRDDVLVILFRSSLAHGRDR